MSAAERVKADEGATRLKLGREGFVEIRDLRWILIDEFQDFSELYYRLISSILEVNPLIRVVAVGDDWQAINGFAGAQLTFFNNFGDYFTGAGGAAISKNRRSGKLVVGAGNELMKSYGAPALAHHEFDGQIDLVHINKVNYEAGSVYEKVATTNRNGISRVTPELAKALKACADFISASVFTYSTDGQRYMPSVLILARTGNAYGMKLAEFGECLERVLKSHPMLQNLANDFSVAGGRHGAPSEGDALIEVMTAHKAKGKEADTVIVLEAVKRQFPKVHADSQLFMPFGISAADVLADERRLFYVAATRAEHRLMFLTNSSEESPYLEAMRAGRAASNRPSSKGRKLGAEGRSIKAQLDRIDRELLIRNNVSRQAVSAWDRIPRELLGLPEVGHFLPQGSYAELAWPSHSPPIAILTGHHSRNAEAWRQEGWKVY